MEKPRENHKNKGPRKILQEKSQKISPEKIMISIEKSIFLEKKN